MKRKKATAEQTLARYNPEQANRSENEGKALRKSLEESRNATPSLKWQYELITERPDALFARKVQIFFYNRSCLHAR